MWIFSYFFEGKKQKPKIAASAIWAICAGGIISGACCSFVYYPLTCPDDSEFSAFALRDLLSASLL